MYRLTTSFNLNVPVDNTKSNEVLSSSLNAEDALFFPNTGRLEQNFDPDMSFKICKSRVSFLGLKGLREGISGIPNLESTEYRAASMRFTGSYAGSYLNQNPNLNSVLEIKKYNEWENQDIIIPAESYFNLNNQYPAFKLNIWSIDLSYDGIGIQTIYNGRSIIPFIELLIDDTKLILAG